MSELRIDPSTGEPVWAGPAPVAEPDRPPTPIAAPVPSAPWERLYAAALRGVEDPRLGERIGGEAAALLSAENLWVLGIILGAWAGASILGGPVAWVANTALAAVGLYQIGDSIVSASTAAGRYAKTAYQATTTRELQEAGGHFQDALVEVGGLVLTTLLTGAAFRAVKVAVLKIKPVPQGAVRARERVREQERARAQEQRRVPPERAPRQAPERLPPERAPRERAPLRELAGDGVRGVGAQGAGEKLPDLLPAVGGVAVGALALLGIVLLARRRRRRS